MDQPDEMEVKDRQIDDMNTTTTFPAKMACRSDHRAMEAAMRKAQREEFLTKGRLVNIQWKKFLPSTARQTQYNGQCGCGGGMSTTALHEGAWALGQRRILPMTRNLMVTNEFEQQFCQNCWGKNRELVCPDRKNRVSSPHCSISYEDNLYCIKDLQSKKGTFVNGIKLNPLSPRELVDGDIISLGINISNKNSDGQKKNAQKYVVFCYQAPMKTVEPEVDTANLLPMAAFALDHALILSEILSSLPLSDLKNVRLVNKEWNKESSKWFYAKSIRTLPPVDCTTWETFVEPYWAYYNNTNVSVALKGNQSADCHRPSQKRENREQGLDNLKSFFQNNGKHIRVLDLQIEDRNLHVLLIELKCLRNLRELSLAVDLSAFSDKDVIQFRADSAEGFPNVEKLSFDFVQLCPLSVSHIWNRGTGTGNKHEEYFKYVLKMLPSLSTLVLGTPGEAYYSTEMFEILKENPELVETLTGFSIKSCLVDGECLSICQTVLNWPFRKPLKSLELGKLDPKNHEGSDDEEEYAHRPPPIDPAVLTRLVEKFSESLEHLSLEIGNWFDDEDVANLLTYTIPPLPKLKTLELTVSDDACEHTLAKVTEPTEHFWFNFQNSDGLGGVTNRIDYGVMFPHLKTLIFNDPSDETDKRRKLFGNKLMGPFIPRVGDVKCPSLTKLVLPEMWRESFGPDLEYRAWLTRLTEIFPNVHSPFLRTVRAGKWDELEEDEGIPVPVDSDADVPSSDDGANSSDYDSDDN